MDSKDNNNINKKYEVSFVKGVIGDDEIIGSDIPQIAFVGRSNVGKSSTINALLGEKVAYPSNTPGKTSEINYFSVTEGENHWYVVDLPGYGFARVSQKAAEKFRKRIIWYIAESGARPEYVVLVVDSRRGITDLDADMLEILRDEGHNAVVVLNKVDKLNQKERVVLLRDAGHELESLAMSNIPLFECSAQNGKGIDKLKTFLFS